MLSVRRQLDFTGRKKFLNRNFYLKKDFNPVVLTKSGLTSGVISQCLFPNETTDYSYFW